MADTPLGTSGLLGALAVLRRRWIVPVACAIVLGGLTFAAFGSRPTRYVATAMLTTVSAGRPQQSTGLAAALLNSVGSSSMQASPAFLAKVAKLPGVMRTVALTRSGPKRIIERVTGRTVSDTTDPSLAATMAGHVTIAVDAETGVLTVSAREPDSALARAVVNATVSAASDAFVQATRSQAQSLRTTQDVLVDSATRQLRVAEARLREFQAGNRSVAAFSEAAIQQRSLERDVELAQQVYQQAVTERASSVQKELETVPALAILDPVAPTLPRQSGGAAVFAAMAAVVGLLAGASWLLVRQSFA